MILLSNLAWSMDLPYLSYLKDESIKDDIIGIQDQFSDQQIREIFSTKNLKCDFNILLHLSSLGEKDKKIVTYKAMAMGIISDVETDILLQLINTYESIPRPKQKITFSFSQGKNLLKMYYVNLFNNFSGCLENKWINLKSKILFTGQYTNVDQLHELNIHAHKKRFINDKEYKIVETLRKLTEPHRLSIKNYHKKVDSLLNFDFKINQKITKFHISQSAHHFSYRYNIYKKYNIYQMNEMAELVQRLVRRSYMKSTSVIMINQDDQVSEKNDLNPIEQFHYAQKLFQIEKNKLLESIGFKGYRFEFIDLLIVAFELSIIQENEFEALLELIEKVKEKVKEKTLTNKTFDFVKKYQFLISSLSPPLVDIFLNLAVGILGQYFDEKEEKNTYKHDLFYGNCEAKI